MLHKSIPQNILNEIKSYIDKFVLTEASDTSIHEMYDKIYGEELISRLLELDPSKKKKFAEWVLKAIKNISPNTPIYVYPNILRAYLNDTNDKQLQKLAKAFLEDGFQLYTYKDIPTAFQALHEITDSKVYDRVKPVYNDGTIEIYNPTSQGELKDLLVHKFRKKEKETNWCVADDGTYFWDKYTKFDTYNIYLIYNISQNKLYLWNDNPNKSDYGDHEPYFYDFSNWGNVACDPIEEGGLTQGAVEFLDLQSNGKMSKLINKNVKLTFEEKVAEALERVHAGEPLKNIFDNYKYWDDYEYVQIEVDGKFNIINDEGNLISPNQWFDQCYTYRNGLANVEVNGKWNFMDTEGNFLWKKPIDQWFDNNDEFFYNGFAVVELNDKYNFIDTKGNILYNKPIDQWFKYCDTFGNCGLDNFATVVDFAMKCNFINTEGNFLWKKPRDQWFDYNNNEDLYEFYDDIAKVKLNGKYNFIDNQGKILFNQWFDDCGLFDKEEDGFVNVKINDKWYLLNHEGNIYEYESFKPLGNINMNNIIKEAIDKILNEKKQGLRSKILFDLIQKYGKPYMSDVDLHLLTDDEILHVSYKSASNKHLQELKKEFNTHQFICGRGYIVVVKYNKDKDNAYNKKIGDRYNERYAKVDGAKEYRWHNKEAQDLVFKNPYFRKEWDKDIQDRAIDNIKNKRNFYNGFEKIKNSKK